MSGAADDEQLTRKQRREQARAQRKATEQAQAASAARRTRLTQLGIVGAIVVAAAVAIAIATSGGGKKGLQTNRAANQTVASVSSLLAGIPQSGNVLGSPNAPVTLQFFSDLECPVCKQFVLGALSPLIEKWVRPGKLKIEDRGLETATRDPETFKTQQAAALAAGKQGKMWHYLELFYHEQGEEGTGYVTESYLRGLASQVPGLNLAKWNDARKDPAFENEILSDSQAANSAGFRGTPSFLLGRSGGTLQTFEYASLTDPSRFDAAIERLLKG